VNRVVNRTKHRHENPHGEPHENLDQPCDLPQEILFYRIGDTIVLRDSTVPVPPDPLEEAEAFLDFLQEHGLAGWVPYQDFTRLSSKQ
jgi:hypothetical protein